MKNGFTLIELLVVLVVLGILSGVAIPKYMDVKEESNRNVVKGILGNIRTDIDAFFLNQSVINRQAVYPTLAELTTDGTVFRFGKGTFPQNPFNKSSGVQTLTWNGTSPPTSGSAGWNYDATEGKFWANSTQIDENLF